ncbi:MAG TPA: carboxypeptidase regulatory-like domain-containing protein, partial [Ignavibacteria bacterium]
MVTKADGTPIADASITLSSFETDFRTTSDSTGIYHINNIPAGRYDIKAELAGYKDFEKKNIRLKADDSLWFDIVLKEFTYTTEEIDVVTERFRQAQNDMRTSLINLSPKTTKIIPGVGEDVLRSLQTLPGVSAPNDFSSQLIVRGSGPDQNLIVMDDIEIFNPYRLYGVFSMFNPETLSEINLMTGGFPAKYGDRLSAVLDVTNKEGSKSKYFTGLTNVNIANANLVFSGKLP